MGMLPGKLHVGQQADQQQSEHRQRDPRRPPHVATKRTAR
jgi:hypothetical protein